MSECAVFEVVKVRDHVRVGRDGDVTAGGTCWVCQRKVGVEVVVADVTTNKLRTVGVQCAAKLLTVTQVEHVRQLRQAGAIAARDVGVQRQLAARAVDVARRLDPHGTVDRYVAGCRCLSCCAVAPHRSTTRFWAGCSCLLCVDAVCERDGLARSNQLMLVELDTAKPVVDARRVVTSFGERWRSDRFDVWLPYRPASRMPLEVKGFTEADVDCVVRPSKKTAVSPRVVRVVTDPVVDRWGQLLIV